MTKKHFLVLRNAFWKSLAFDKCRFFHLPGTTNPAACQMSPDGLPSRDDPGKSQRCNFHSYFAMNFAEESIPLR